MYTLANLGDFFGVHTGFGGVGYNIYSRLPENKYDIHQLAISYSGDAHELQRRFKFYTTGRHPYGYDKFLPWIKMINPDIFTITQDPWIAPHFITKLRELDKHIPAVLYTPVDSEGLLPRHINVLNQFDHVVTYTEWAKAQLLFSGLTTPCSVITHGVDFDVFKPVDKQAALDELDWPDEVRNGFIVSYVAKNSARKRVDLFIWIIDEWLKRYPHDDVYFLYHGELERRGGTNVGDFIDYLDSKKNVFDKKLHDRFLVISSDPAFVVAREKMHLIYNVSDVYLHISAIEGFGMPISEAMACQTPVICPDYSAMSEWCNGGVFYVPVLDTPDAITSQAGTVHKYIDPYWAVEALENLYQSSALREKLALNGYQLITQPKFDWQVISNQFDTIFSTYIGA